MGIKDSFEPILESDKDENLLVLFLKGNDLAYTTIYNRYVNTLFAYGTGLGFEKETLKDAIQDIFYKLYSNRKVLSNTINLKYYLLKMLKNRLLDIHKTSIDTYDIAHYEFQFSIKATILDELVNEEDKVTIQNKIELLFNGLTARQRESLYLRFIQEMEYDEIGTLLEMTPQAARKLVFRAIKRIRKQNPTFCFLSLISFITFHHL